MNGSHRGVFAQLKTIALDAYCRIVGPARRHDTHDQQDYDLRDAFDARSAGHATPWSPRATDGDAMNVVTTPRSPAQGTTSS